ncbi:MAG TPA: hypothetical protein VMN56_03470 [Casimicrobiaceae bacterium]|nr:hypothetical protein [Casimicrobiaceae bacterium]
MSLRFRIIGAVIVASGLAVCYGAFAMWPASFTALGVLQVAGAVVVALVGIGNVIAGAAVFFKPARD